MHDHVMQKILEGNGINDLVQQYLDGEILFDDDVDETIQDTCSIA